MAERRVLVTGWFSFADGEATAGDLEAAATLARWLGRAEIRHDVACSPVFGEGAGRIALGGADPRQYSHLVFVCGPVVGHQVAGLLDRFTGARRLAVGVSVVDPAVAARFDVVLARDAGGPGWPDLAFGGLADDGLGDAPGARTALAVGPSPEAGAGQEAGRSPGPGDGLVPGTSPAGAGRWPVVAVVRANPQPEYGSRARHQEVHTLLDAALAHLPVALVDVDTRVDPRLAGQRSAAQVIARLAVVDLVVTTRLHGLVLALRAGAPAVAVDPVEGGGKVLHQAVGLGWPAILTPGELTERSLGEAVTFCLGPTALATVASARRRASAGLNRLEPVLLAQLGAA